MKSTNIYYSVIVPAYNEEKNVAKLHGEILAVMNKLKEPFEIIFVNDGSSDKTFEELKELSPVIILDLRRNFGQSVALDAGIKNSKGEIIITMDGDGQNDPADIPNLLKKLNQSYDVVCGWRHERKDSFSKKFISGGAAFLRKFLVNDGVHDAGCTLRVYKRESLKNLDLYGELHRMIPALLRWQGFKITETKVSHRARGGGKTKYSWERTVKGFLDMIGVWFWRKYEGRPLHLFGGAGLFLSFFSFLFGFYLGIKRIFFGYRLSDKIWPQIAISGFLVGIQFVIFGLLADLIIKNRPKKNFYQIREIIRR